MITTRRRFLTIAGTLLAGSASYGLWRENRQTIWQGKTFGAEASITIYGDKSQSEEMIEKAVCLIRKIEKSFSIYDPQSEISQLNQNKKLKASRQFLQLMSHANKVYELTDGLFDPTVQSKFIEMSKQNYSSQSAKFDWKNVVQKNDAIEFERENMAITFNGIAQGFAADRVSQLLNQAGLKKILVNTGEYKAGTKPSHLALVNSTERVIANLVLKDNAVATSSPDAYRFTNGNSHIIAPDSAIKNTYNEKWKTISVVCKTACMADGLSTALALSKDKNLAKELVASGHAEKIIFEDQNDNIFTI